MNAKHSRAVTDERTLENPENLVGAVYVLLLALEKGLLSRFHVKDSVSKLARRGFRISIEFYLEVLNLVHPFDHEVEDHFIHHTFGEK